MLLFEKGEKKDISFLENEFLSYLVMLSLLGKNDFEHKNKAGYFELTNSIVLVNSEKTEKISINSLNLLSNKELITALQSSKKVTQVSLKLSLDSTYIEITLKSQPIRISSIKAPNSIAEELDDIITERILYIELAYDFFERKLTEFSKIRVSEDWFILIKDFRKILTIS